MVLQNQKVDVRRAVIFAERDTVVPRRKLEIHAKGFVEQQYSEDSPEKQSRLKEIEENLDRSEEKFRQYVRARIYNEFLDPDRALMENQQYWNAMDLSHVIDDLENYFRPKGTPQSHSTDKKTASEIPAVMETIQSLDEIIKKHIDKNKGHIIGG